MNNSDALNALNVLNNNIEEHIIANGPNRNELRRLYGVVAKYIVDADAQLNQRVETKNATKK